MCNNLYKPYWVGIVLTSSTKNDSYRTISSCICGADSDQEMSLEGGDLKMGVSEMSARLKEWIEGLTEKEVTFKSDSPEHDWPFIQEIFDHEGWPKNLHKKCGMINFDENRQKHRYIAGLENYWKTNLSRQHHALVDAKSLLFAWKFALKKGM